MGFTGKVIKVVDGNTIDVLTDDQETIRIRFSGIDTPERGQPFGNNVPRRLKELVAGEIFVSFRKVMIDTIEQTDRPTDRQTDRPTLRQPTFHRLWSASCCVPVRDWYTTRSMTTFREGCLMSKPKYSLNINSGQARVWVHGKQVYLGRYNSPESFAAYERFCAEMEAQEQRNNAGLEIQTKRNDFLRRLTTIIVPPLLAFCLRVTFLKTSHAHTPNRTSTEQMKHLITIGLILCAAQTDASEAEYRIQAAKGPYFLCDERVTEDRWLAERFVVPLRKHADDPLIITEYDWEGSGPYLNGSVLYDPEQAVYRMWYSVWNSHNYYNKLPFSYNICYAESKDGIQWQKPALGVFTHESDPRNNCIRLGTDKTQAIDVCLNPQPDRYPGRFLAIHNQKGGVFVSSSEDGSTFTFLHQAPAIGYHSDTHNNFVYDEVRDRWMLFCRPRAYAGDHKRRVSMQSSSDLQTWTHERTLLVPSETEKPEFYGMGVFRRGDLLWGIVKVYDRVTGLMHGELAWSGDGEHWSQLPTHPLFLERGAKGSWDYGMVIAADTPVTVEDEMRFYYSGSVGTHHEKKNRHAIGLAIAERDRLVGLRPTGEQPGYVLTRPLLIDRQSDLKVNVVVAEDGGRLRAELRNDGNHVLDGFSLDDCDAVGDSGYGQQLTWQGKSIGDAPLSEVRIRFEVVQAQLFTFDVGKSVSNALRDQSVDDLLPDE
jgi:hypothetical protein